MPINWDRVAEMAGGSASEERQRSRTADRPHNEFVRLLTGFSSRTIELMIEHGFSKVQEDGSVPIMFTGISQAPKKQVEVKKPTIVKMPGLVAVTGLVDAAHRNEIGKGQMPIKQADVPNLDGYDAPGRFNVSLGRPDLNFDEQELARAMAGTNALVLSGITSINGREVLPYHGTVDFDHMWRRPARIPSFSSRW